MMDEQRQYLSMEQAAQLMGVSRWTIWRRIRAGDLPAFRGGVDRRAKLVRRADVERLMQPQSIDEGEGKAAA